MCLHILGYVVDIDHLHRSNLSTVERKANYRHEFSGALGCGIDRCRYGFIHDYFLGRRQWSVFTIFELLTQVIDTFIHRRDKCLLGIGIVRGESFFPQLYRNTCNSRNNGFDAAACPKLLREVITHHIGSSLNKEVGIVAQTEVDIDTGRYGEKICIASCHFIFESVHGTHTGKRTERDNTHGIITAESIGKIPHQVAIKGHITSRLRLSHARPHFFDASSHEIKTQGKIGRNPFTGSHIESQGKLLLTAVKRLDIGLCSGSDRYKPVASCPFTAIILCTG